MKWQIAFVIVLSSILITSALYLYPRIGNREEIPHFTKEYLNTPLNRTLPHHSDPIPQNITSGDVPYRFQVSWAEMWGGVYTSVGGVFLIKVNNTSEMRLYVKDVRIYIGDMVSSIRVLKEISGEEDVGFIHVPAPLKAGEYILRIELDLYSGEGGLWHYYPSVKMKPSTITVKKLQVSTFFKSHSPDLSLYNKVNDPIWNNITDIRDSTIEILKNHTGEFGLDQILYLYLWIQNNIHYISDPGGLSNYWASPIETLKLKAGDCEDVALLLGGMITSIGGNLRVVIADNHAYLMVYVGKRPIVVLTRLMYCMVDCFPYPFIRINSDTG